ncbi:hypothetical protein A9Q98_06280 [Thalassotalea sp. 42_200_T64]|nr:hypothetical protein A9Q98_06280 [Thalassotalea sp. 42_200_T64]
MAKKNNKLETEQPVVTTELNKEAVTTTDTDLNIDETKKSVDVDTSYQTVLVGFAPKLSSKSTGKVGYELALNDDDKKLYLRLTSNDSGGLFSKEWVSIEATFDLLEKLDADKPFKSSVFKAVIKGGSANNVSFFSAVMRCDDIALVVKSDKSQFLHVVNPLLINRRDYLMKLKPLPNKSEKAKK